LVGRCWRNVLPAPPVDFCDPGDTADIVQIAKLVMQIHANCVLIIDEIKNFNFLMGGAGAMYVKITIQCSMLNVYNNLVRLKLSHE